VREREEEEEDGGEEGERRSVRLISIETFCMQMLKHIYMKSFKLEYKVIFYCPSIGSFG